MIQDFLNLTKTPQKIVSINAFQTDLKFLAPFKTAKMDLASRPLTLVRIETDLGVGWGECAALPQPFYNDETAASCFSFIANQLGPELTNRTLTVEMLATETKSSHYFSFAAIEMALLFILIENSGGPGSYSQPQPYGPVLSLSDDTASQVAECVAAGASRIKLKASPTINIDQLASLTKQFPEVRFDADANGSFSAADFEAVVSLYEAGIQTLEQPFDPKDTEAAQRLVGSCEGGQLVCADEAATTHDEALAVVSSRAANAICVKPSRLGGLFNTLTLVDELKNSGTDFMFGGTLESGLGRIFLAIANSIFEPTLIGDLTPSGFLYSDQPFSDLELKDKLLHIPNQFSSGSKLEAIIGTNLGSTQG